MAPQYKFTYFDFQALGEFIRFLFAYGEIEYEDNRIDPQKWPELKASFPNGKMPLLEEDGKAMNQSTAIGRYLARKLGLMGSDDWEALAVDSAVENLNDVRVGFVDFAFDTDEASKAKKKEKYVEETLPTFLTRLEKQVKENGGYFVGGKVSLADIYLAAYNDTYKHFLPDMFTPYPALQGVIEKVYAIPTIKAWIEKRPKRDF